VPFVVRTGSALPNPQLAGVGLEAEVRLRRHVTLTGGFLLVDLPQRARPHVQLPLVAATTMGRIRRVYVADRNRFEQVIGVATAPVRYRNRVFADLPVSPGGKWHLFGDDEIFFDFSTSTWNQNRLQLGGGMRVRSGVVLDLFYLQRHLRGGVPTTHVFGTTLKVTLKPLSGEEGR
jgi:hypothetical protein